MVSTPGSTSPRSRRPRLRSAGWHSGPSMRRGHRRGQHGRGFLSCSTALETSALLIGCAASARLGSTGCSPRPSTWRGCARNGTLPTPLGTTEIIMEIGANSTADLELLPHRPGIKGLLSFTAWFATFTPFLHAPRLPKACALPAPSARAQNHGHAALQPQAAARAARRVHR